MSNTYKVRSVVSQHDTVNGSNFTISFDEIHALVLVFGFVIWMFTFACAIAATICSHNALMPHHTFHFDAVTNDH